MSLIVTRCLLFGASDLIPEQTSVSPLPALDDSLMHLTFRAVRATQARGLYRFARVGSPTPVDLDLASYDPAF